MAERILNPFLYGKPVPPERFIGREEAVRALFGRIHNMESTAVVGEPHIGKSSVLRYIVEESVRSVWLAEIDHQCAFIEIDAHALPTSHQPADLWQDVATQIELAFSEISVQQQVESARQGTFSSYALERLFRALAKNGSRVVLIVDEFDVLLHHPNFGTANFFGVLRSLSTRTNGLALVTASRLSIADMNRRSQELSPHGSPFFNGFIEVQLLPLNPTEIDILLDRTLQGTTVIFSQDDRTYVRRMAGRHPYLVQAVAAALFEAILQGKTSTERYQTASLVLQQQISAHFEDLWQHLTPQAQTVAAILVLAEVKGHLDGRDFKVDDLEMLDRYGPELKQLADIGFVERDDGKEQRAPEGNFVLWRGQRWRVSAGSFVWWIADNAIADSRKALDFKQWLHDREYEGLLTQGQKEKLTALAGQIPQGVITSVGEFLRTFLKGWISA